MQAFTDFALDGDLSAEPDPRARQLARRAAQQAGRDFYFGPEPAHRHVFADLQRLPRARPGAGLLRHRRRRRASRTRRRSSRSPHLRNLYQKVGMFGMPAVPFLDAGDNGHQGDQIRGFGFLHDGSIDTVFRFLHGDGVQHARSARRRRRSAGRRRAVHARLRHQPGADRRPAGDAATAAATRSPARASTCSSRAPRPASATWS